jgi:hypothetical protein
VVSNCFGDDAHLWDETEVVVVRSTEPKIVSEAVRPRNAVDVMMYFTAALPCSESYYLNLNLFHLSSHKPGLKHLRPCRLFYALACLADCLRCQLHAHSALHLRFARPTVGLDPLKHPQALQAQVGVVPAARGHQTASYGHWTGENGVLVRESVQVL